MTLQFRPAKRSEAKPLIGLYSESGCGKTYSALLLARGFVGDGGRIAMIETESGRGEAYADQIPGGYDVLPLRDDFAPRRYGEAISAAEQGGYDALIIDSASHEWEGAGGVLDQAAKNREGGSKSMLVWQKPKGDHQRYFMLRLMQTPIPLVIVCMRAKYPMKEVQQPNGKREWVRSEHLEPKQADDILYEMFIHGWIDQKHRLHVTKYTRQDLAEIIPDGQPISADTGRRLAAWARGEEAGQGGAAAAGAPSPQPPAAQSVPAPALVVRTATDKQREFASVEEWRDAFLKAIDAYAEQGHAGRLMDLNEPVLNALDATHPEAVRIVRDHARALA